MKSIALKLIIAASFAFAAAGAASAQEALAKSSGCLTCHAVDTKKMGPSFKEVAAKYKGNADAEKVLVAKLSGGKDHPATKASPAEIAGLVKWVLATP
jgi:cytochrome c